MKLRHKILPLTSLSLISLIACPLSLTSCNKPQDNIECKVHIDPNGGVLDGKNYQFTKIVKKGSTYGSLGEPTRDEYDFDHWEKDGSLVRQNDKINGDVTIKAIWSPQIIETCTVTIDLNGGKLGEDTGIIQKTVNIGSSFASLGTPSKMGFNFHNWIDDKGNPISLSDTIRSSISIKAVWGAPTIVSKNAKFYEMTTDGYLNYQDSGQTLNVYLMNDSQVPYVTIKELFDDAIWPQYYELTHTGNVFTVKNKLTSSTGSSITCTFDIDNQTITFNGYDKFICYYTTYADNPLATGCGGGSKYQVSRADDFTSGGIYSIDLKEYNIPIYCDSNNAYIPYEFCYNIFDWDLTGGAGTQTGSFIFVRNNFYEVLDNRGGFEDGTSYCHHLYDVMCYNEDIPTHDKIFNLEYREYCYNLLALTLDNRFGMTTRPSRADGETIEYFPNGAYEEIQQYHDDFVSTEPNVANDAMIEIMKNCCDDGGHAGYYGCDVNTYNQWTLTYSKVGKEFLHTQLVFGWMDEARSQAHHELPEGYDSNIEILSSSDDENDIAWVTFDSFKSATPTYSNINASNYMHNGTIGMTMRLQQIVNAADSTINKIVIDLSNNGGGAVYTEHVLASYLCGRDNKCEPHDQILGNGGVTHTIWNPHSKAFSKYTYYADINGDHAYTSADYLPANVQVYCIVSDASFSCGNMLPSHLADCSNCKFIGSRSGGGACYVDSNMHIGLGNVFRSSSNFHSLKNASTQSNPITVDEGVTAQFYPIVCDEVNAYKFFDRDAIISYIMSH